VFSSIANEMQQLSKAIASANRTVYELASTMAKAVPELVHQNQSLARVVDGYAVDARERIDQVDRRVAELRSAVATTLAESDHALAEIVSESHAALSELQFQDVCAQGLLQIDTWMAGLSHDLAAEMGVHSDIPPPAHVTVSDDDVEVNRAAAGEVMMF
jgi:ABC-type transporter Mla subunit MlaD